MRQIPLYTFSGTTLARMRAALLLVKPTDIRQGVVVPSMGVWLSTNDFESTHRELVQERDPSLRTKWYSGRLLIKMAVGGRAFFLCQSDHITNGLIEVVDADFLTGSRINLGDWE